MTFRIGEFVLSGELRNSRRNGVFGWIEFAPDYGIRIELTGNFHPSLRGTHLRFRVAKADAAEQPDPDDLPDAIHDLADRQIGVVGDMLLRKVKVPDLPVDVFLDLDHQQKARHLVERDCLYLEWHSQNGRVVAEIIDPTIEFVDPQEQELDGEADVEPLVDGGFGVGFTEVHIDENGVAHSERHHLDDDDDDEESEDEDPYGLFGSDLEKRVAESLGGTTADSDEAQHDPPEGEGGKRPWDEVIPGIDPETKAMYEQWDEIFEGKKDEPISYLFETPLKLPRPMHVDSEEEAESLVKSILAQLALLSVALDVCEHYTPIDTYRLLMDEILPTAKVHPNLAASEMVQHYSTSDFCPACEAEFDAEYEGTQGDDSEGEESESSDGEQPDSESDRGD